MNLSCGIVGLPNVGKSTLFNALTGNGAAASNFPFCTIEPNIGVVPLPDSRLLALSQKSGSKKIVPAYIKFVDIAGLVEGASKGEGLGNKFLSTIRETQAIVHVVRCFDDPEIIHVMGNVDPGRDRSIIETELVLADMQLCENLLLRLQKQLKTKKELSQECATIGLCLEHLNEKGSLRSGNWSSEQLLFIDSYPFLTRKPMIYAANISEVDLKEPSANRYYKEMERIAADEKAEIVVFCAELEAQIAQFEPQERTALLEEMGLHDSGLDQIIKKSFALLGLITYITTGEIETRAWTIRRGSNAQEAAGEIHTEIAKGFIRAEVIPFEDFLRLGRIGAKEAGLAKFEGKTYQVKDGDIILFYHN